MSVLSLRLIRDAAVKGGGFEAHHLVGHGSGPYGGNASSKFVVGSGPRGRAVRLFDGANHYRLRSLVKGLGFITRALVFRLVQVVRRHFAL